MKKEIIQFENITQFANYHNISEYDVFLKASKDVGYSVEQVNYMFEKWVDGSKIPYWVTIYIKRVAFFIA